MIELYDLGLFLLTVAVGFLLFRGSKQEEEHRPPGPMKLPFFGNNPEFMLRGFEKTCTYYNRKYGDIVECELNKEKVLIISDPNIIKHVTVSNGVNYLRRFTSKEVLDASMREGRGLVFNNDVENWKFHRRVFKRTVQAMIPVSRDIILRNVHNLFKHWDETLQHEKPVDINEYTHRLSLDLIGELAFGLSLDTVSNNFTEISDGIYKGVNAWMESFIFYFLYPNYWKILPSPTADKFKKDLNNLAVIERKLFRDAKLQEIKRESFLKRLSEIVDNKTGRMCNEEEILQDIREMLAGGSDTSANTLTYVIYFLCRHPQFLEKAVEEVDLYFDENNLDASLKKLTNVENSLNEAMRLIPAGPLIFRKSIEDDYFYDYKVPANTNVILNIWHTMTSEKYWKDPFEFNPDRFLEKDSFVKFSFVPFGEGRRGCPGRPLALYEMKVILAMLLKHYSFTYVGKDIKPWWGLVEHCGHVWVKISKRCA